MVTLDWSPSSRADSYNVYWSIAADVKPGAAGVSRIEGIQGTSYAHVGLTNGTKYSYAVTAVSTGGESVVSVADAATPQPPAPGPITSLTATADDAQVKLSWTASSEATAYTVYWATAAGIVPGGTGVTKIEGITASSYTHTGLTNGTTYYYAISATGPGGEGALSNEVSARPLPPPPPAPLGFTAVAPKDVIEVRLQWFDVTDYPSAAAPMQLSYNVYRGLEPGVATYYKDATRATKFADVTAPLVDASVSRATTYYYVVTAFVPGLPEVESVPSGEVAATTGRAGGPGTEGGGGEGGHDEGFGNNLSFPLIYADGYGFTGVKITGTWPGVGPFSTPPAFDFNTLLRPLSTEVLTAFPLFSSTTAVSIGGIVYYPQKTESAWQAEWRNNAQGAPIDVIVDWGDALLSRTYRTNSIIRVETTLKQDATVPGVTDTMTAYKMALLSGSGITELQGTDKSIYASAARNVYAINARLKIEKIASGGGGDLVIFDKAIYETFGTTEEEGGGSASAGGGSTAVSKFGAEINVSGSVVYGYNFRLSAVTGVQDKTGQYRITFSLDPNAKIGTTTTVPGHVTMIEKADAAATLSPDGKSSSVVITVN